MMEIPSKNLKLYCNYVAKNLIHINLTIVVEQRLFLLCNIMQTTMEHNVKCSACKGPSLDDALGLVYTNEAVISFGNARLDL